MNMRAGVMVAIVVIALFGAVAWYNNRDKPVAADAGAAAPEATAPPEAGGATPQIAPPSSTDPGIVWTVPKPWLTQISGGMRLATYIVPGAAPNSDGECAVYYFGPGAGGGVDANIERWTAEFTPHEKPDLRQREVRGMKISVLKVRGTFSGHTMRADQDTGPRPGWGLLGAIVQGPAGDVFFKLTGPAKTVDAAAPAFDAMIASMRGRAS